MQNSINYIVFIQHSVYLRFKCQYCKRTGSRKIYTSSQRPSSFILWTRFPSCIFCKYTCFSFICSIVHCWIEIWIKLWINEAVGVGNQSQITKKKKYIFFWHFSLTMQFQHLKESVNIKGENRVAYYVKNEWGQSISN